MREVRAVACRQVRTIPPRCRRARKERKTDWRFRCRPLGHQYRDRNFKYNDFGSEIGVRIGAYRIVALIGRGGMGEVYRAERADGQFEHQVALKLIRPEAAEHLDRFHTERQILARLEHPGIVRLLDGGVTVDNRPFMVMVMELVDGRPMVEWCSNKKQI